VIYGASQVGLIGGMHQVPDSGESLIYVVISIGVMVNLN